MTEQLINLLMMDATSPLLKFFISIAAVAISAIIGIIITKIMLSLLEKVLKKTRITHAAIPFILSVTKIFCYVLIAISILTSLNVVDASSIVTALGAVGLAVSLAVKDSLSNLMGGFLLILAKTMEIGDYVEIGGESGTVVEINLIHTVLATVDNKIITIPNGQVTNARITNYSAEDTRRVDVYVTVDKNADIKTALKEIKALCESNSLVLKDKEIAVHVEEHTDLGTKISAKVWCESKNYWDLYYDIQEAVKETLEKAGIKLAVRALNN